MPNPLAVLAAGTLAFALAVGDIAQQRDAPYEHEHRDGVWIVTPGGDEGMAALKLTAAERAVVTRKRDALFALMQGTSSFNPPKGLALRASRTIWAIADSQGQLSLIAPLRIQTAVTVGRFLRTPAGDVIPFTTEMPRLEIVTNDLRMEGKFTSFWYEGLQDADGHDLFLEPPATPAPVRSDLRIFRLDESRYTVAVSNGRPLWLPVTAARFLRAMISQADRDRATDNERRRQAGQAEIPAAQSFEVRRRRVFESEFAALTEVQRQAPAYYATPEDPMRSGLASACARGARPVVSANLEYFDPRLPRTAVQLIACRFDFQVPVDLDKAPGHHEFAVRAFHRLLTTFEYEKLAGLIERTR